MPIVLILAVVFYFGYYWYRRAHPCRWQRTGGEGTLKEFTCKSCGVKAYSAHYDGPKDCKKHIHNPKL